MRDAAASANPRGIASPFLDEYAAEPTPAAAPVYMRRETPFLSEYDGEDEAESPDAMAELHAEILGELEDEELEDALHALVDEASEVGSSLGLERMHEEYREQALREHLAPLGRAVETLIDQAEARAETLDYTPLSEGELEELFEGFEPDAPLASPAFEMFWKGLKNKIKKVARAATSLAKKGISLAAGPLLRMALGRLRALIRPLLQKVLQLALDKIPAQYRPLALQVAQKLGIRTAAASVAPPAPAPVADPTVPPADAPAPAPADAGSLDAALADATAAPTTDPAPSEPATPDAGALQGELDLRLSEALLAPELHEQEWSEGESAPMPARDPHADLDAARERFVREVLEAEDASEAEVIVERFLPAVLLAARTAVKLIGRPKVVNFLGGLISKLIGPFVGNAAAPALGRVVADLGLRTVLQAEVSDEDGRAVMAEALAGVVEDTVRRVANVPVETLESPELGEAMMREAFDAAAAASFPAALIRPELRESEQGGWVSLPLRGRKHYRKYSRVFDVAITPQMARSIATYGGGTLADFLRDRLRMPQAGALRARVHVYQALPRTRLARIARSESARGLGSSDRAAWSQIHPLTPDAAGMLTGSPALGREFDEEADPRTPMIGERYYYLEIPEAPPRPLGRQTHLHFTLDVPRSEIRACLYLSEVVAQRIATGIRKQEPVAQLLGALRSALAGARQARGTHGPSRRMRVLWSGAARPEQGRLGRAARRGLRRQIQGRVMAWLWEKLPEVLGARASELIAKTEGPEDGVRIAFAFAVPALRAQRRALLGRAPLPAGWLGGRVPSARIELFAGARHD